MTILCEPNKATAAAVAPHLDTTEGVRVVDNLTDAAAWVGYDADERLVVIGAAVPFIDVVAFADYMHTIYPDALLVLVRDQADDDVMLEAMAAGIIEVVPAADEPALAAACDRARQILAERAAPDAGTATDDVRVDPPATESPRSARSSRCSRRRAAPARPWCRPTSRWHCTAAARGESAWSILTSSSATSQSR